MDFKGDLSESSSTEKDEENADTGHRPLESDQSRADFPQQTPSSESADLTDVKKSTPDGSASRSFKWIRRRRAFETVPSQEMIIHFVRHSEGEHNAVGKIDYKNYKLEKYADAVLTDTGREQCNRLMATCERSGLAMEAALLVVSPLRRTLQTASFAFPNLIGKIPWIALDEVREVTGIHPCDRRNPVSQNSTLFPHVDFGQVIHNEDPAYHLYTQDREPDYDVIKRAEAFLEWLNTREEKEIIVVTHSAFLRVLFNEVFHGDEDDRKGYENCEMRSYNILV